MCTSCCSLVENIVVAALTHFCRTGRLPVTIAVTIWWTLRTGIALQPRRYVHILCMKFQYFFNLCQNKGTSVLSSLCNIISLFLTFAFPLFWPVSRVSCFNFLNFSLFYVHIVFFRASIYYSVVFMLIICCDLFSSTELHAKGKEVSRSLLS